MQHSDFISLLKSYVAYYEGYNLPFTFSINSVSWILKSCHETMLLFILITLNWINVQWGKLKILSSQ